MVKSFFVRHSKRRNRDLRFCNNSATGRSLNRLNADLADVGNKLNTGLRLHSATPKLYFSTIIHPIYIYLFLIPCRATSAIILSVFASGGIFS